MKRKANNKASSGRCDIALKKTACEQIDMDDDETIMRLYGLK
jgi:hypothetical protein